MNRRFAGTIARGADVSARDRARLAVEVAQLKVGASDTATDVAHRVFEATGTSSTASRSPRNMADRCV